MQKAKDEVEFRILEVRWWAMRAYGGSKTKNSDSVGGPRHG